MGKITFELKETGINIDTEGLSTYEVLGIMEMYKNDLLERLKKQKRIISSKPVKLKS